MNDAADALRQSQIAFQGRMVAGATHEMQNHLAVIKECNGLVRDLLKQGRLRQKAIKRCVEISSSIEARAVRAAETIDVLNSFAHRGDDAVTSFGVNSLVEELVVLLTRAASQSTISLEAAPGKEVPSIINSPSLLEYLLFSLVAPLIDALEKNGSVVFSTSPAELAGVEIKITAEPTLSSLPEAALMKSALLGECLSKLAATISFESTTGSRRDILLTVPSLAEESQRAH